MPKKLRQFEAKVVGGAMGSGYSMPIIIEIPNVVDVRYLDHIILFTNKSGNETVLSHHTLLYPL